MAPRRTRSSAAAATEQLSSPPPTPAPTTKRATRKSAAAQTPAIKKEAHPTPATPPTTAPRKRTRQPVKKEEQDAEDDELPHNLGSMPSPESEEAPPAKKRATRGKKTENLKPKVEDVADKAGKLEGADTHMKRAKKENNYGLSPGQTPYPDWPHPTPEECKEVVRLLSKVHGQVKQPKEIKPPSLTTAGCGEVPSVLDALIRTRLSAATTGANSSRAFQSLVKTFGIIDKGVGKGSVNWNAVRLATQQQVFDAIQCGGLANNKSKDIKAILESVYEENQARAAELKDKDKNPAGADTEAQSEKKDEISRADEQVLSLDHLHLLSNEEAFNKMIKYPGIGPKTASCVLLFCLQRPSFAVDTHVFRLCRYLGWVPPDSKVKKGEPKVGRETTYSHCEVRVPDEYKYALHQLLIKHGKTCPRCRAATGLGSERWSEGCPIDHLVKRHGAKKGGGDDGSPKKGRGKRNSNVEESDEESEMSDLGSEDEE
ncbi:hypothetical protein MBLNU457_3774t1 [Dothideomycetes sp. NU457]